MNIHIKRMDLFAVLTLTNAAGRTFVTTLRRDILKTDSEVREMVRRFRQDKKVIQKELYDRSAPRGIRGPNRRKTGVGIELTKQGDML